MSLPRLTAPSKDDTELLPPFVGLRLDQIEVPVTAADIARAVDHLLSQRFVGFDTESKPTFAKGEAASGPHVVQFATTDRGYIFQVRHGESLDASREALAVLLQSQSMVKVGFGLKSDRGHIERKLGAQPRAILDLTTYFKQRGYRNEVGVRGAVAMVLQARFQKSKRVSTSNWANAVLSDSQLLYAANDAYGAICVLTAMKRPDNGWPIIGVDGEADETANPPD
jgi:ribonuclease D